MKSFVFTFLLFTVSFGAAAQDEHQHGHAQLNIVIEGSVIEMELVSPSVNILGFEHEVSTEQEQRILQKAQHILLSKEEPLFVFTAEATCLPTEISLESAESDELLEEESHNHDHDHDLEEHNDIHLHYVYSCKQPAKLAGMKTQLFNKFTSLDELDVQVLTAEKQISKHLDKQHSELDF